MEEFEELEWGMEDEESMEEELEEEELEKYRFWIYSDYGGSPIEKCTENDDLRSCCEKLGGEPIYFHDNMVDCRFPDGETIVIWDNIVLRNDP